VSSDRPGDASADLPYISTGHLPSPEAVRALVSSQCCERFKANTDGRNSDVRPALADAPQKLFGLCAAGSSGSVHAVRVRIGLPTLSDRTSRGSAWVSTQPACRSDGGVNPDAESCRCTLAVMATAGLYEASGDWPLPRSRSPDVRGHRRAGTSRVPRLDHRRFVPLLPIPARPTT